MFASSVSCVLLWVLFNARSVVLVVCHLSCFKFSILKFAVPGASTISAFIISRGFLFYIHVSCCILFQDMLCLPLKITFDASPIILTCLTMFQKVLRQRVLLGHCQARLVESFDTRWRTVLRSTFISLFETLM